MNSPETTPNFSSCAVVGRGRLGTALSEAFDTSDLDFSGPLGRGADCADVDVALLCVPDAKIAAAAELIPPTVLVGHCSGATELTVFGGREAFSLHPLMTFAPNRPVSFAGAGCAVAGNSDRALATAHSLASQLGMNSVKIAEQDRAIYHAAASIASNFLVTLEATAERLADSVGLERELLIPLVRAAVDNWAELGTEYALTGPIARGDKTTVDRQRRAIEQRAPELLPLYDTLAAQTRQLALTGAPA